MELPSEQRRDLARQSDHGEQVDAIHGRNDVENLVADREHVDQRRPRLDPVGQQHDSRVILTEADLVLGEDHPARRLTAQLALVERLVEDREVGAGQRDRDRRARIEVPGTADDLSRVPLPHVDLADAQPVGVRMGVDLEDAPDEEAPDVPVRVGDADVDHALDLERGDREPLSDLGDRRVDGDVLAEPGERRLHRNCPSSRGSLRQSSRRSGIPCRSTAMRSSPQPNANPV